jgi:D-serine deaminase-like pyridoxal phosphate-dependent protein
VDRISQECGVVVASPGSSIDFDALPVGTAMRLIPNHSCMTASGYRVYHVVDADHRVIEEWRPCHGW